MKYFELDKEENRILADFNADKYKRIPNSKKAKSEYQQIAKTNLKKTRNVNIRLSERDLQKIRSKAVEKGIPYQTLMASVLHQYLNENIKTRA